MVLRILSLYELDMHRRFRDGWKAAPGVGPTTALAILSTVDGPDRFKHARRRLAYR
jgi:transposase